MAAPKDLSVPAKDNMLRRSKKRNSGNIPVLEGNGGNVRDKSSSKQSSTPRAVIVWFHQYHHHSKTWCRSVVSPYLNNKKGVLLILVIVLICVFGTTTSSKPTMRGSFLRMRSRSDTNHNHETEEKEARCKILQRTSPEQFQSILELDLKQCGLVSIPREIQYCTALEKLDVSGNPQLSTFPTELAQLTKLQILFSSQNTGIHAMPTVLGSMPSITRLGWRSGALTTLEATALPPNLIHLILTDNQLRALDDENVFIRLANVRKLMLSHNQIQRLSSTGVQHLQNLELLRLAGNQLTAIPDGLWALPKLTWLTLSGNPGLGLPALEPRVPSISLQDVARNTDSTQLGQGASGTVSSGKWHGKEVAIKTIHGVTSDGNAEDELAIYGGVGSEGMKHRVVGCLALFQEDGKNGVIMERIPPGPDGDFPEDLALPPTIVEVTADRWIETASSRPYDSTFILNAVSDVISAVSFLHEEVGVAHGDLYAHNMKVDRSGHVWLLDFGASWAKGLAFAVQAEKIEVRAVGVLVNELLDQQRDGDTTKGKDLRQFLQSLARSCLEDVVDQRPSLQQIRSMLNDFQNP